jgi:CubicO group peptidase (beta-lactamase class C family)
MPFFLALVTLFFWACNAASSKDATGFGSTVTPAKIAQIDGFVTQKCQEIGIAGYGIEIIDHGKIVYQKTFGFANIDQQVPVTAQTVFGLASVTKTFTALALLKLVDDGKVKLDSPIGEYIPKCPDTWNKITVRNLALMTGGFPHDVEGALTWPEQLKEIKSRPLLFEPGSRYQYSNLSYRLIGQIIENVSGKEYLEYVSDVVLQPAGMNSTGTAERMQQAGSLAQPYRAMGNGALIPIQYKPSAQNFSAGMLCSSLEDMAKYASALADQQFLSAAGYRTMWSMRPTLADGNTSYWGFGWGAKPMPNGNRKLGMNGGLPGVASSILIFPDYKIEVVALSSVRKKPIHGIAQAVGAMIFAKLQPQTLLQAQPPDEAPEE